MRILIVSENSDLPHLHTYLGLAKLGHSIMILGTLPKAYQELAGRYIEHCPFNPRSRLDLRALRQLKQSIAQFSPVLIFAATSKSLSLTVLATINRKIPIIGYRGTVGHISRLDPACWLTYLSPKLSGVWCVSEAVRQYLSDFIPIEKLHTIYKGHDINWYSAAARSSLPITTDATVISCTANMRKVKGVDVLLEAFTKNLQAYSNLHLMLIGEIRDQSLYRLAEADPRIHLMGFRTDATSLTGASDIAVLPSRSREGLPKSILEAMALGKPVIASAVGGIPEIIDHNRNGLLVPPEDPQRLAQAIISLAEDNELAARLGQMATETIREKFSIDNTIKQTAKFFESVTSEGFLTF